MSIAGEFLKQIILVVFYLAIIIVAVKLGIYFRKKKNIKENSEVKAE